MGILKRLKNRIGSLATAPSPAVSGTETFAFEAALPLGNGSAPLWRVQLQMVSEPQADGERVRLRAHIQTNFASALRPALRAVPEHAALPHPGQPPPLAVRAGQLVQRSAQRALATPLVGRLMEPLLRLDLNTWIEVQTSSASLDAGAHDLLPQSQRLAALGIQPRRAGDQPVAESWAGEAADGFAQVSVLQMDKRHLPSQLQQMLGDQPFSLAAAIVNTAQQK